MNTVESLNLAWRAFDRFTKTHEIEVRRSGDSPPLTREGFEASCCGLAHFNEIHPSTDDHIRSVLIALCKGKYLIESALLWDEPVAGPNRSQATYLTSRARGEQWRLVMASGGLETISEAIMPPRNKKHFRTYAAWVEHLVHCCSLPDYGVLRAPNPRPPGLIRWLDEESLGSAAIIDFLKMGPEDAQVFRSWVVEDRPVAGWSAAMQLARALRNATAHGALSATKVKEWNLQGTFRHLSLDIGAIAAASLHQFVKAATSDDTPPHLASDQID